MEFDDIISFLVVVGGILLSAFGGKKKPKQKATASAQRAASGQQRQGAQPVVQRQCATPTTRRATITVMPPTAVDDVKPAAEPKPFIPMHEVKRQTASGSDDISAGDPYSIEASHFASTEHDWRKAIIASEILKTKF
ncbi:MAG: hypothetical protein ACI4A8_06905 [Muribaculaceae bacterium]